MIYKDELIIMYASLEKNPVVISYPDGQPSKSPKNKQEKWELNNFMQNNRFTTIYTFGNCKIVHYVSDTSYRFWGLKLVQELRFYTDKERVDFASLRYYHVTDNVPDYHEPLMQLYQDVKHKSRGKSFTNPISKIMQQNVLELQSYARNAMAAQDAEEIIADLNKIKSRLLETQHIKSGGK